MSQPTFTIGLVDHEKSPIVGTLTLTFSDLSKRLSRHAVSESKSGLGWTPASYEVGPRTKDRAGLWSVLGLDIEGHTSGHDADKRLIGAPAPALDAVADEIAARGWSAALATSWSHEQPSPDGGTIGPRFRIVLAISRPIDHGEVELLARYVAATLGLTAVLDPSGTDANRLFFFPAAPALRIGLAQSRTVAGEPLPVDDLLVHARRMFEPAPPAPPSKPATPLQRGPSVIDTFNEQADVGRILESHGYKPAGRDRWIWPQSSTGEAGVVRLDDGRIYSHHPNDVLAGDYSHDAFSVWATLEHAGDQYAAVRAAAAMLGMSASTRGAAIEPDAFPSVAEWPEPQPLTAKIDPRPYPIDALPPAIRAAVDEVGQFVQAPVALVVSSALAALSAAAQGHVDVRRAERLQGPSGLFVLAIADSGERKSTLDSFFTGAIRDYERQQAEAAVPVIKRYTSALAAWAAEREGVLQAIKQATKSGKTVERLRAGLAELEERKPEAPRIPRLIYGDSTPEALTYSLATRWPSGAVISAEAGAIFGAHGMSPDSIMRNLAIINELWDGKPQSFDRRSTESYAVRGARLTVGLAIQGATLREFLGKSGALARGSGFLARFLICSPESTQGKRLFSEAPKSWPALAAFNRRIAGILDQPVAMDDGGALTPTVLELSSGAKQAWIAFHDAIESSLAQGGELHDVRDVASKSADNAARLAGLFHTYGSGVGAISEEAFASASRIVAWHLSESRRFFGELAVPTEIANAAKLDAWLIEHCQRERVGEVSTKTVQHRGPGPLRDRAALQPALAELEELGRIRVVAVGKRRLIEVNPALLPLGGSDGA
jgi:hypothetical protein